MGLNFMAGSTFVFNLCPVFNVFFLSSNDRTFTGAQGAGLLFFLSFSPFFFFPSPLLLSHPLDISALFRYLNSPLNSTMQKEDSPSHQNIGTYMEY
jgi:hypothetical protein